MIDPQKIDELAKKLSDAVPPGAKALHDDLQQQFKQILQMALARLDLVTREEFDVQSKVLARTRARLEALEAQVQALEEAKRKSPEA